MATKKKANSEISLDAVREIADMMLSLEEKNRKRWSKKPLVKRGEDLLEILASKYPGLNEDTLYLMAMWVDLEITLRNVLVCEDELLVLMNKDEALESLYAHAKKSPHEFEMQIEWVNDFGCLLTEGRDSDIGAWFHDWIYDQLSMVGATDYLGNYYYLELSANQLSKFAKSKIIKERITAGINSKTQEEDLKILSSDPQIAVRFAVAKNSATSKQILDTLASDENEWVRQAALDNPSVGIEVLLSADSDEGKVSLASSEKANSQILKDLASEKDESIRIAVAENENSDEETLLKLAKDKVSDVRDAVARNPVTPLEALSVLVKDKDEYVRGALADRQDLGPELFEILAKDKSTWVRCRVAENTAAPQKVLEILSKDSDSLVREYVLENSNLAGSSVAQLANPIPVKFAVARNRNTPIATLEILSAESDNHYHQGVTTSLAACVASNPSLPPSILMNLMKSKDERVIQNLASNPTIPQDVLLTLVEKSFKKEKSGKWRFDDRALELGLAANPKSPVKYLEQLLHHVDTWVVSEVASNPSLPPTSISKLAKSSHENVRKGVAKNPSAPWILLQSLMEDESNLWDIANNPAARSEDLEVIASRKGVNEWVLADIAKNPSAPLELLKKLSKSKNSFIKLGVASNSATSSELRAKILESFMNVEIGEDEHEYVGRCPYASSDMLEDLTDRYRALDTRNRTSVLTHIAGNINTPTWILEELSTDRGLEVRIAVAGNPSTPVGILENLGK